MEMLHGESLADRLVRLKQLPAEEVIRFLSQVLRAIGKAHESGIVHRDLKPDNVFICNDEPEFAKVLDFGVAKVTHGELSTAVGSRTQTGMMIGTPYYMSPEQTQAKEVDARADLWGIAVIAYECLVGRKPFTGDSFGELVIAICTKPVPVPSQQANVPPRVRRVVREGDPTRPRPPLQLGPRDGGRTRQAGDGPLCRHLASAIRYPRAIQ